MPRVASWHEVVSHCYVEEIIYQGLIGHEIQGTGHRAQGPKLINLYGVVCCPLLYTYARQVLPYPPTDLCNVSASPTSI